VKAFPFAAIVGQEKLKRALMACAINHSIGGVLVRGEKGTAKSTAARALAQVMPPILLRDRCNFNCPPGQPTSLCDVCTNESGSHKEASVPFVNLPLGATEDRVIGSLDFERALKEGRKAFQPGLLASANRGILYIDEVNLLADHLVDTLLDVAAMGENHIQREGLSFAHPAYITLIGTMNPEEGDLRPQLLDRFGIMVEVLAPQDTETRVEVVKRRMGYEHDTEAFCAAWRSENQKERDKIVHAQKILSAVVLSDHLLNVVSSICCELKVTSLRADIVMNKVAKALAALDGRKIVSVADIRDAAELVLPHRKRQRPTDRPGFDEEKLESLLNQAEKELDANQDPPSEDDTSEDNDEGSGKSNSPDHIFAARRPENNLKIELRGALSLRSSGKRSKALGSVKGQSVRALKNEHAANLAIHQTIQHSIVRNEGKLAVSREDFHEKTRVGKIGSLVLFVVDSSGSMAALKRMELVKGTAIALLDDVYQRRDNVAVITFRGEEAELTVSPTRNIAIVEEKLAELPTGGRTPLSAALRMVAQVTTSESAIRCGEPIIILLCDGKANVSMFPDVDPWQETLATARELALKEMPFIVINTEVGRLRFNRSKELAEALQADYLMLDQLSTESLAINIRARLKLSDRSRVRS